MFRYFVKHIIGLVKSRFILGAAFAAGCLFFSQPSVCAAQKALNVEFTNGRVDLNADQADLKNILQILEKKSGIDINISDNMVFEPVTLHLQDTSLENALKQLLKGYNHTFVFNAVDGIVKVTRVYVLPTDKSLPPGPEPRPADHLSLPDSILPNGDRVLEEALKSDSIPDNIKAALLDQSLSNNDETKNSLSDKRAEAMDHFIGLIEKLGSADPEIIDMLRNRSEELKRQESGGKQ